MERWKQIVVGIATLAGVTLLVIFATIFSQKFEEDNASAFVPKKADVLEGSHLDGGDLPGQGLLADKSAKEDEPEPPPVESELALPMASDTAFRIEVLVTGLGSPGGIAVHPTHSNLIFIAEEDNNRIIVYDEHDQTSTVVIDRSTPIYRNRSQDVIATDLLGMPEGICFGPSGDLFVVEDRTGGRLIRFPLTEPRHAASGYVIPLPGAWGDYAWEDVDVGVNGEILLAGSTAQNVATKDFLDLYVGTILYKDMNDNWWIPYERRLASFSSIEFSKSGNQAIFTGEISGEIGWIDLSTRRRLGGNSEHTARGAEGLCVMPDGSLLVGMEEGTILHLDPSVDKIHNVIENLPATEYLTWDSANQRALVSDDKSGSLLALWPIKPIDHTQDKMLFATYQSILSQLHIPKECPPYLAEVLKLGGLDYHADTKPDLGFREFTSRVPMVAAKAQVKPVPLHNFARDPIEHLEFVVFEPNNIGYSKTGVTLSLAGFYVRTQSGKEIKSTTKEMAVRRLDMNTQEVIPQGLADFVVPHASSVTVSSSGAAAINFTGMGATPDFSVIINPQQPEKSYMAVFYENGTRDHYKLSLPDQESVMHNWIVAYSNDITEQWQSLQGRPTNTPDF
jgi:hypothetical protein